MAFILLNLIVFFKYAISENTFVQEIFAIIDDMLNDMNLQPNINGGLKAIQQLLSQSLLYSNLNNNNNNNHDCGYPNSSNSTINNKENFGDCLSPTKNIKMNFIDFENVGSDSAEEQSPFMTDKVLRVFFFFCYF
jgi:hypothetical protein